MRIAFCKSELQGPHSLVLDLAMAVSCERFGLGSAWFWELLIDERVSPPSCNLTAEKFRRRRQLTAKRVVTFHQNQILHGPFIFKAPISLFESVLSVLYYFFSTSVVWCLTREARGGHVMSVRKASLHGCKSRFSHCPRDSLGWCWIWIQRDLVAGEVDGRQSRPGSILGSLCVPWFL